MTENLVLELFFWSTAEFIAFKCNSFKNVFNSEDWYLSDHCRRSKDEMIESNMFYFLLVVQSLD